MYIFKYFIKYHLSKYGKMLILSIDDIFSKIGDQKVAWSNSRLFSWRAERGVKGKAWIKK